MTTGDKLGKLILKLENVEAMVRERAARRRKKDERRVLQKGAEEINKVKTALVEVARKVATEEPQYSEALSSVMGEKGEDSA